MNLAGLDLNATRALAVSGAAGARPRPLALDGAHADLPLALNLEHRHPVPNLAYHQPREATTALQARIAAAPGYRSLSIATR